MKHDWRSRSACLAASLLWGSSLASHSVRKAHSLFLFTLPLYIVGSLTSISTVKAQVSSDGTVSTTVTTPDGRNFDINDGTTRGGNLFHSFKDFSVPTGGSANFKNALDVQNIIGRVTGGSVSNIEGAIRALGNANLFLLNPAGIIFGSNASLQIGGSFLGSTANSLLFDNGFEFSATNPQAPPLLTINVPIGLGFRDNPGTITVQGEGHKFSYATDTDATIRTDSPGLQVQPGKTLALVGGNVLLEGGNLRAESGRIELGSIASPSLVNLRQTDFGFALGYSGVQNFGDIQLSQRASADASGEGGGEIQVQSRRLSLRDGASILSISSGSKPGGTFSVNATESVELIGQSTNNQYASSLSTESQGSGSSGDLRITTGKFIAKDGAYAQTYIVSSGNGGNLTLQASESIELIGRGLYSSGFYTSTGSGSSGNGGDLSIETGRLSITDGATVDANTESSGNAGKVTIKAGTLLVRDGARVTASTFGGGDGGNLTVTADRVELIGTTADGEFSGGLFAQQNTQDATANAGNLTINTRELLMQSGAQVSASTFGAGNGGNLIVTSDKVKLIGTTTDGEFSSGLFAQQNTSGATGNGGDLTINTRELLVRDRAGVSVQSLGTGTAGNLTVNARAIRLDNNGTLRANTRSNSTDPNKQQATVTIRSKDLILRRGSNITANATGTANGGNITITTDNLVGLENSDITANAFSGNGGNITIRTQGLFGIQ
ncbi:two-partner secretion domain-containing protein, partial [Brasilonema octagenarum]